MNSRTFSWAMGHMQMAPFLRSSMSVRPINRCEPGVSSLPTRRHNSRIEKENSVKGKRKLRNRTSIHLYEREGKAPPASLPLANRSLILSFSLAASSHVSEKDSIAAGPTLRIPSLVDFPASHSSEKGPGQVYLRLKWRLAMGSVSHSVHAGHTIVPSLIPREGRVLFHVDYSCRKSSRLSILG